MTDVVIGIDIGGTITKIGIVEKNGNCISKESFRTKGAENFDDFIKMISDTVNNLLSKEINFFSIGIGAPNANIRKGTIETPANLNWNGKLEIVKKLKKYFKVPIILSNDANCAAMGEMLYGNAKKFKDFILITLGTGLGSGIVSNGKLIQGFDGFAGELGHISIFEDGRFTGLGVKGGLEAYVSAVGLKRTIMYMLSKYTDDSVFRKISFNELHGEDITRAAENNDPIAKYAYKYTGKILGKSLANFVSFSQPEAIILTGGLANSGKWILEPTKKYFQKNILPFYRNKVKIIESGLEEKDAAILGAAAIAWK